jgi:hypothetical protein
VNFVVDDVQMLYILCYMCIWMIIGICELHMQRLMGKQEKSEKISAHLPCVCTRQRHVHTAKAILTVHHTAKAAHLCTAGWRGSARQSQVFAVRVGGEAHGKECRTAKKSARQRSHNARQSCVAQSLCRAIFARRTINMALSGRSLPSNLYRAWPHGKGFAELICPFAVRFWCTAKSNSPVVDGIFLKKQPKKK